MHIIYCKVTYKINNFKYSQYTFGEVVMQLKFG